MALLDDGGGGWASDGGSLLVVVGRLIGSRSSDEMSSLPEFSMVGERRHTFDVSRSLWDCCVDDVVSAMPFNGCCWIV